MGIRTKRTIRGDWMVEHGSNGGFYVQGPDGRTTIFDSFHAAKEFMERSDMMISNKYGSYSPQVEDAYCEDHYKEAETCEETKESIDYEYAKQTKEYLSPKQQLGISNRDKWAAEEARSQPINEGIARIQAEIDRVEKKIASTTNAQNKQVMTTYVAGLTKALKLLKGE